MFLHPKRTVICAPELNGTLEVAPRISHSFLSLLLHNNTTSAAMPPPRRRRPDRRKLIHALARAGGWMTALGTITVLGYIIKTWPHKAGAVSAGIVGVCCASLPPFHPPHISPASITDKVPNSPLLPSSMTPGKQSPISTSQATSPPSLPHARYCTICSVWPSAWAD